MNRTVVKALTRLSMVCAFGLFVGAISVSAQSGLSANAGFPNANVAIKQALNGSTKSMMTRVEASSTLAIAIVTAQTEYENAQQQTQKLNAKAKVKLYTATKDLVDAGSETPNALTEGFNSVLPELSLNSSVDSQALLNGAIVLLSK